MAKDLAITIEYDSDLGSCQNSFQVVPVDLEFKDFELMVSKELCSYTGNAFMGHLLQLCL